MKPELILLVGPQGSGKTRYAKNGHPHTYISQDEQGKEGHLKLFFEALERGDDIIVDRINHLRAQRRKYLIPAKKKGYKIRIRVMSLSFDHCFANILKRKNHPSIKEGDEKTALRCLRNFKDKYERVLDYEADQIDFVNRFLSECKITSESDWFMKDLTSFSDEDKLRTIVIGDPHGCFDEVQDLLEKVGYDGGRTDRIIFVGDLIDRGPKIKELINFYSSTPNVHTVMGNHEQKYLRYLRGNPVQIANGMQDTIDQMKPEMDHEENIETVRGMLENLPYAIKLDDNIYVVHAGIDPRYSVEAQKKEPLLYMRNFAPGQRFDNMNSPRWYDCERSEAAKNQIIIFGHNPEANTEGVEGAIALDGGCVFGGELRAMVINIDGSTEMHSIPARKSYSKPHGSEDHETEGPLEPFERRVSSGLIKRQEKGDLVLYNYTKKCQYDSSWDDYTMQARGIIFDRNTGKCIARPFTKFFNLGEREETRLENLTLHSYECFDKLDGSCGIVYNHNSKWNISTRGSFESEQAIEGQKILDEKYQEKLGCVNRDITLLFEIIYPENRVNDGARLVCDYGDTRDLVLLAAIWRTSGEELDREWCEDIAKKIGMPIAKKYDYTINEMIKLQETLPSTKEGFVVKFSNGLRVKIKGKEYLKMHKLINGLGPLTMWEAMDPTGFVPLEFMQEIPEEIFKEINGIKHKLELKYYKTMQKITKEAIDIFQKATGLDYSITDGEFDPEKKDIVEYDYPVEHRKAMGLYMKEHSNKYEHTSAVFPFYLDKHDAVCKYIMKAIKPKANVL